MDIKPPNQRRGQYDVQRRPVAPDDLRKRLRSQGGSNVSSASQAEAVNPKKKSRKPIPRPNIKLPSLNFEKIAVTLTAIILLGAAAYGVVLLVKPKPTIPTDIRKQLSFGVYYPQDKSILDVNKKSFGYDSETSVLSFTGKRSNGTKVSFNEQATPDNFVDIPQIYDKLVESLHPYTSFDSVNGKVSLTHPAELKGGQSAILNAQGTLMFVRPDHDLTDTEWRQLFTDLHLIRK